MRDGADRFIGYVIVALFISWNEILQMNVIVQKIYSFLFYN